MTQRNLLYKLLSLILCFRKGSQKKIKNININSISDVEKIMKKFNNKERIYRLWIPCDKICMQGAFRYGNGWHPFVTFLENGIDAFDSFYKNFQPRNIVEMYFVENSNELGCNLEPWMLPWAEHNNITPPADEGGLSYIEHGASYFGKVSNEKLSYEQKRLLTTRDSIINVGYKPDDEINGFFLKHENNFVFFVRGGKHRAAILSFLGYPRMPVVLRKGWKSVYSSNEVDNWDLVKANEISKKLALEIFTAYFKYNGKEQFYKIYHNE